jgi:hypothetical protein
MKRIRQGVMLAAALMLCGAAPAAAWHLTGHVTCDGTGLPFGNVEIQVVTTDGGSAFAASGFTDADGNFSIALLDEERDYRACAVLGASDIAITPPSGCYDFSTTSDAFDVVLNFVISSPSCAQEGCWLTGGGAKFSNLTGTYLGDCGKWVNFGGNVNPGCSPTAGDGGQWNNIDAQNKLHFQGFAIQVVRCGNVDEIPPGSDSPKTPYNFIEFTGTGRVKGIKGNKADYPLVYFFGRCEDRNEPGSNGQRDGAYKDRYFLHVYLDQGDPVGSTIMLVDQDGDPSTVDPVVISDGNLQIHVSSCDAPAPVAAQQSAVIEGAIAQPTTSVVSDEAWLSPALPNPTAERTLMRFSLPRAASVTLRVYDVAGRQVSDLVDARLPAGVHTATWDLRDRAGRSVGGGVYFVRLSVDGRMLSRSISVAR